MTPANPRCRALQDAAAPPPTVRVAIYTRKSTAKGLDQDFNSIDAQRQAVEAFVQSQRGEGWQALPEQYDDGGFTGANIDRPAFQRLMADIEAGKIDLVAVYRLDRLSRSQADLYRLLEFFEQHGITFVSITENFNTTTPMGRFALGILGQVAQLEREVTAERVRDKVSASRRKGLWTGGRPVLGYGVEDKRLVVHKAEGDRVRAIYQLYLDLGSLLPVVDELSRRGWTNKSWTTKKGTVARGTPFTKNTVHRLLTNALYVGKVREGGDLYEGVHEAIIEQKTWDAVQAQLKTHGRNGTSDTRNKWGALLKGLMRCGACGAAMTHHYTARGDRRYAYYVCMTRIGTGAKACPGSRVPVGQIEAFVVDRIRAIGRDPGLVAETIEAAKHEQEARVPELTSELRGLEREQRRLTTERTNVVDAVAQGGAGTQALVQRLAEMDQALETAHQRTEDLQAELVAIQGQVFDEADLRTALASFDPVWEELFPRERARILQLLIETVTYDAPASEVAITFRPGGVKALAEGTEEQAA